MNYSVKHNLLKLRGAFTANISVDGTAKPCLCIPFDSPDIFVGDKGIYLDSVAFESHTPTASGSSHYIKPDIPKEKREAMTEEERRSIPIIGSLTPQQGAIAQQTAAMPTAQATPIKDEIPY